MRTAEDIENYLIAASYPFDRVSENMWRVSDETNDVDDIFLIVTGQVLTCQLRLFKLPNRENTALFRRMLEMNFADLVHGAFAISGDDVLLIEALELDNLDRNELQATVEAMGLGARLTYRELANLLPKA